MQKQLNKIKDELLDRLKKIRDFNAFKDLEVAYMGRKGKMTQILRELGSLSLEERQAIGKLANSIKNELQEAIQKAKDSVKMQEPSGILERERIDATQPILGAKRTGHLHPLTQVQYEIEDMFRTMGFMILDGPELESEYYNFEALNIPSWHPARDMQDTFYVKSELERADRLVMRTQTSSVQVRAMQKYGAPLLAIVPGRVFRSEATDARHETTFDQVEGFMIAEDISLSNLSAIAKEFLNKLFKEDIKYRFRPGYFPFVEPGVEVDLACKICKGAGCKVCKNTGWVEFMGAGMIHPNVLKAGNIDSNKYQGFAFGFGITRLVMMRYGIDDIRLFLSGDLRFLEQF